jgi:hypothetical protein
MRSTAEMPRVRQLASADLPAIVELQQSVLADLPAGFLRPRTANELAGYLDGTRGAAFGIEDGAGLAATGLVTLPSASEPGETLATEIARRGVVYSAGMRERISDEDWMRGTCFLGNDMVRRAARGRGYQRALITARLAHAAAADMRWAFSGVHLGNAASWRNLLAHGMAIIVVRFDPRHPVIGLIRAVSAPSIATDASDRLAVAAHEPSQHEAAVKAGYVGVRRGANGAVVYEKLLPSVARAAVPKSLAQSPKYLSPLG